MSDYWKSPNPPDQESAWNNFLSAASFIPNFLGTVAGLAGLILKLKNTYKNIAHLYLNALCDVIDDYNRDYALATGQWDGGECKCPSPHNNCGCLSKQQDIAYNKLMDEYGNYLKDRDKNIDIFKNCCEQFKQEAIDAAKLYWRMRAASLAYSQVEAKYGREMENWRDLNRELNKYPPGSAEYQNIISRMKDIENILSPFESQQIEYFRNSNSQSEQNDLSQINLIFDKTLPDYFDRCLDDYFDLGGGEPRAPEKSDFPITGSCECSVPEGIKPNPKPLPQRDPVYSPIILDLDGDGVESTSLEESVYFDHNNNRFAYNTGWVGSDDALLVWDRNGNGQIDGGVELFGNNSILADGTKAANGFELLAEFDTNGDGVVNQTDELWSELMLWQDRNGNGTVDDGELMTLEEVGVAGLNVDYQDQDHVDENGNEHRQAGTFIRDDGTVGEMTDVWFKGDLIDSRFLDEVEVDEELRGLPNLRGWGTVPSMHQVMAMEEDGRLRGLLEEFVASDDVAARRAMIWDIIYAWTGVTDHDPTSRGPNLADARKLYAMEQLTGEEFLAIARLNNPAYVGGVDGKALTKYFQEWENKFGAFLLLSSHYSDYYRMAASAVKAADLLGAEIDVTEFISALQEAFAGEGDSSVDVLSDVIHSLSTYDTRGKEYCQVLLRSVLTLPPEQGEFMKWVVSSFYNADIGDESLATIYMFEPEDRIIKGRNCGVTIYSQKNNDTLLGGDGDDSLYGNEGNDILHGGRGDDYLEGGRGDDVYWFGRGDGHDVIRECEERVDRRNVIRLWEGIGVDDVELLLKESGAGNDLIVRIKDTGDTITVKKGLDKYKANIDNFYSIQAIQFADGTVWEWEDILRQPIHLFDGETANSGVYEGMVLVGNDLDNTLNGGIGNDILHGGVGNDTLVGDKGDDIYLFGRGDGHDIIVETGVSADRRNIIRLLDGIGVDDIEFLFRKWGNYESDLIIRIKDTGETIAVKHCLNQNKDTIANSSSIQAIQFADGTVLEMEDILRQPLRLFDGETTNNAYYGDMQIVGNDSGNTLKGGIGNDTLRGGTGNDTLQGEGGDDVYLFGYGGGHDTIIENERREGRRNVIRLDAGIGVDDIELLVKNYNSHGCDLIVRLKDTGETITVQRGFLVGCDNEFNLYSIQAIEFGDGTVWEWEDILRQPLHLLEGETTNNALYEGVTIVGNDLSNTLKGGADNDILHGGIGNDVLQGGYGNDILWGGAGNDTLDGGFGDNVYLFGYGDGHDTIIGSERRNDRRNVIRLGEGVGVDDVELLIKNYSSYGCDLIVRLKSTGETITAQRGFSTGNDNTSNIYSIQAIEFNDGTVWEWEDILRQPLHLLEGETINNAIYEGAAIVGNDFGNTLKGGAGNDILHGGAGDDVLQGGYGNDILWGGAGNDTLNGGFGDDVYLFGFGDGHDTITESELRADRRNVIRLQEGIGVDDIELLIKNRGSSNCDLIVRLKNTGETITVQYGFFYNKENLSNSNSIQAIEFGDGTVWEWGDIVRQPLHLLEGETSNNVIYDKNMTIIGNDLGNTLRGGTGNDILRGGGGNDTMEGGLGNDVYLFGYGDGDDMIIESGSGTRRNVIRFREGIGADDIELLVKKGTGTYNDLVVRLKSTGETISVSKGLAQSASISNPYSIQAIEFADGLVWEWADILQQPLHLLENETENSTIGEGIVIFGNSLGNRLRGGAGNDILWGGTGTDRLEGGAGNDTYLFNLSDGQDTIFDSGGNDTLLFGEGIENGDIWFSRNGYNLVIDVLGSEDQMTIENWFYSNNYKVETLVAGDRELAYTQMDQLIQALASFGTPQGVDGQWTDEQKEALTPVISSYWQQRSGV